MGNLFSGPMEDVLLYGAIPGALVAFALAMVVGELSVRARLRRHAPSWAEIVVPTDEALFRSQGARPGTAPREVRVLIRLLLVWAAGVPIFWCGVGAMLFALDQPLWPTLLVPMLGIIAGARLAQGAVVLCDRDDRRALTRLARVRLWLGVHHLAVFAVGTVLFALFVLSNQFFWNGASEHRLGQLSDFTVLYAIVVLLPTGLAVLLGRRVLRGASFYPEAPRPTAAVPSVG